MCDGATHLALKVSQPERRTTSNEPESIGTHAPLGSASTMHLAVLRALRLVFAERARAHGRVREVEQQRARCGCDEQRAVVVQLRDERREHARRRGLEHGEALERLRRCLELGRGPRGSGRAGRRRRRRRGRRRADGDRLARALLQGRAHVRRRVQLRGRDLRGRQARRAAGQAGRREEPRAPDGAHERGLARLALVIGGSGGTSSLSAPTGR